MKLGTFYGTGWINESTPLRGVLRVTQERIDISTRSPKADPEWMHVDAAGHFHAMSGKDYPTLRSKSIDMPCDGSCGGVCEGEGYSVTAHRCVICEALVEPGTIPGPTYDTIPGLTDWEAELSGEATADLQRLMSSYGERVMLRFEVNEPPCTFFGPAVCGNGSLSSTFGEQLTAEVTLRGAGELGNRPARRVKVA